MPDLLTAEEQLGLRVALATCFSHALDPDNVPIEDVSDYVEFLLTLFSNKPTAATGAGAGLPQDMRTSLAFCADRLASVAPEEVMRLRAALSRG